MEDENMEQFIDEALILLSAAGFRNNYVEKESRGILNGEICYVNFERHRGDSFIELTAHSFNIFISIGELKKMLAN